jgi:hypothetical protein
MPTKILDTLWFAGVRTYGIVLVEVSETGEKKARLGMCSGLDEATDTEFIAATGEKIRPCDALAILKHFAEEKQVKPEDIP